MKSKFNRLLVFPISISTFLLSSCLNKKVRIGNDSMLNTIPLGSVCEYKEEPNYKANDVILVRYLNSIFSREMICCFRIVGLPGDKVKINGGAIFRNDQEFAFPPTAILNYKVTFHKSAHPSQQIQPGVLTKSYIPESYLSSRSQLTILINKNIIDSFTRKPFHSSEKNLVLEASFMKGWNMDYFGPIRIKRQGEKLINDEYKFYYGTSSNDTQVSDDFYFVVADNFYQSFDSRTLGLIPKTNILVKILNVDVSNAQKDIKVN